MVDGRRFLRAAKRLGKELGRCRHEYRPASGSALRSMTCSPNGLLGPDRYAQGDRTGVRSRNGYGNITLKTTAGAVELKRPKLRGTDEAFASRLLAEQVTKTNALDALAISGWVRGLSDRDVEAALAEAFP